MARAAVRSAFKARLAANWTATLIIEPNEQGETPLETVPFVSMQFPASKEEPRSIGSPGSNVYREDGGARIVIAVPRSMGVDSLFDYADQLATLFRALPPSSMNGVETFEVDGPFIDNTNDDGKYYWGAIVVAYTHDIFA